MKITAEAVSYVAGNFYSLRPGPPDAGVNRRRFASHFGCTAYVAAKIWNFIDSRLEELSDASNIIWLLATLYFFRHYPTTSVLAAKVDKDEEVVRVNLWIWVDYLQTVDLVCDLLMEPRYNPGEAYDILIHDTANDPTQQHLLDHYVMPGVIWWNEHAPAPDSVGEQTDEE